jgi:hypothetical protein
MGAAKVAIHLFNHMEPSNDAASPKLPLDIPTASPVVSSATQLLPASSGTQTKTTVIGKLVEPVKI